VTLLGCAAFPRGARGEDADPYAAFYKAFEADGTKAALDALPAKLRDASPYDATSEALAPHPRDVAIYSALLERVDEAGTVSEAARREAALHFAVASISWREGDVERARRRLLLALDKNPFDRMAHVAIARCYTVLEAEALKSAGDKPVGEVLIEKVGVGSSDVHIDCAQKIVDRFPADLQAVTATFMFDKGEVKQLETSRAVASANVRSQREKAALPGPKQLSVVLLAADHARLDEGWFSPVQTIRIDGMDAAGHWTPAERHETTFQVSIELLSPSVATRVIVYDAAGKRLAEVSVAAPVPSK
jgi:hypothetical protein